MAFQVVWEFRVRPGREAEFERRYGADGDWAALFRHGDGVGGTVLLRDAAAYRAFKESHGDAYAALDLECTALTEDERCLGEFEPA